MAPIASPDSTITSWQYTGGLSSGSVTFIDVLPEADYEARYFAEDSYTRRATSDTIDVDFDDALVPRTFVHQTPIAPSTPIAFTYENLVPMANRPWIQVNLRDDADWTAPAGWAYLPDDPGNPGYSMTAASGSIPAGLLAPNQYELRVYRDWAEVVVSDEFDVQAPAASLSVLTMAKPFYHSDYDTTLTASWAGLVPHARDRVALVPAGLDPTNPNNFDQTTPTNGSATGSFGFTLPASPGFYQAVGYRNYSYQVYAMRAWAASPTR